MVPTQNNKVLSFVVPGDFYTDWPVLLIGLLITFNIGICKFNTQKNFNVATQLEI